MKHLTPTLAKLFAILFLMLTVACSRDNGGEDPHAPPGTRTADLLDIGNGLEIGSGNFLSIGWDNILHGNRNSSWQFVSVGPVSGLAEITEIPKTGWTKDMEIIPGNGYVICTYAGNYAVFCKLYAVEYIPNGVKVKLQDPFDGSEKNIVSQNSVHLDVKTGFISYNSENIPVNKISFTITTPAGFSTNVFFNDSKLGVRVLQWDNRKTAIAPSLIFVNKEQGRVVSIRTW